MTRTLALLLSVLLTCSALADDATSPSAISKEELTKLLSRLETLEKRVKELERVAQKPSNSNSLSRTSPNGSSYPPPFPPGYTTQPYPAQIYAAPMYGPPVNPPHSNPSPSYSGQPYAVPLNPSPTPFSGNPLPPSAIPGPPPQYLPSPQPSGLPQQPNGKAIPKTWKPFHFNGMDYYIVPVDEAENVAPKPESSQLPH